MSDKGGWTYIMTNRAFGVLYVGVTLNSRCAFISIAWAPDPTFAADTN
jgi:hypothetical protein